MPEPEDQPEIRQVNPADLQPGPIRRESLSRDQEQRVHAAYRYLAPYLGTTLEQFEIGFLRDANPDSEIDIWLAMAIDHSDFIEQQTDKSGKMQRDVYKCLLSISVGAPKPTDVPEAIWDEVEAFRGGR